MTDINLKKIIAESLTIGIIVSGVITGFQTTTIKKLTYNEARLLEKIYKYEIELQNGVELNDVNKDNLIPKLNENILNREVIAITTIDNLKISIDDYKSLRSKLMEKAEQNSNF